MRETIKGSCMLCHCQTDNGTCVSQYLCSSEGHTQRIENRLMWFPCTGIQCYLLILSAAFQCDVVYRYDLIPNFDSPILR